MRPRVVKEYTSVLDVLDEPGCPLCTFLRNLQFDLIQNASAPTALLCNFHGWGIAAIRDSTSAASVLLSSLENLVPSCRASGGECWVCSRLRSRENTVLSELSSPAQQRRMGSWLQARGAFCAPHSVKVKKKASLKMAALVDLSDARKRRELIKSLGTLMSQSDRQSGEYSGLLGQVAEYLVSQRGLPV